MTVSPSWWCRFASPASSTVVLQFHLPDYFLMHVLKMHVPRPYFQRHWCTRYSVAPMMSMFKAPHVILTKVAPERDWRIFFGPRVPILTAATPWLWRCVSEWANWSKTCTGVLAQQCTTCSKKYVRTIAEEGLPCLISPFLTNLKFEYRIRDADIKESVS